jgi:threonine dehydrogenase-like Zn-dependent dehydrogenase
MNYALYNAIAISGRCQDQVSSLTKFLVYAMIGDNIVANIVSIYFVRTYELKGMLMSKEVQSKPPSTMQAALLRGPRDLIITEVPVPVPAPGEVLVAVEATGLCGSDLHFYTGNRLLPEPMVLGHEFVGQIVAAGSDVPPERLGQRVVAEPNIPCGQCTLCRRGLGRICSRKQSIGQTRWGSLADYVVVPEAFAWQVPTTVAMADAATIEPTAVATHAISQAGVAPGAMIAVVGCGGVGMSVVAVAIASGYRVVAIEPNEHRRAAAMAAGAERASDGRDVDATRALLTETGVIAMIECAGFAATTQLCLDSAPPGSRIVLVGLATENVTLNPLRFVRAELDVKGSMIYDHPRDFATTIDLVVSGKLKPGKNTAPARPLADLVEIFEAMESGTLRAKPIVVPRLPNL